MALAECPNCRRPIPAFGLFFKSVWSRWRCVECGALLGLDVRRRLLATIPWIAILLALMIVLRITNLGYAIAVPMLIAAALLNYHLFDRVVVHERTGFRCRQCGYDLLGQVEPRCPECGAQFDRAELAAFRARGPAASPTSSPGRAGLVFLIVASGVTLILIGGIIYTRSIRSGAAPAPAPATRPAATQSALFGDRSASAPAPINDTPDERDTP